MFRIVETAKVYQPIMYEYDPKYLWNTSMKIQFYIMDRLLNEHLAILPLKNVKWYSWIYIKMYR